eukprot:4360506-Alexandrium_andersonii.AAC.1
MPLGSLVAGAAGLPEDLFSDTWCEVRVGSGPTPSQPLAVATIAVPPRRVHRGGAGQTGAKPDGGIDTDTDRVRVHAVPQREYYGRD